MRHLSGYYVSCRNPLTKQENAFINLGCIFVAIRDRLGSFRLLTHPVDPTHPQTWGAMVLAALGQASWKHDQWAQMPPRATTTQVGPTCREANPAAGHVVGLAASVPVFTWHE